MTDGDFPYRNFTVRPEGYDRDEVDALIGTLQGQIADLRGELVAGGDDARLHDPEGAVTRTLAIAQETADRVLHDAQVEADRRRAEADEQAATKLADAESRAAKMMADIETQTAEVRAQGVAAARSAIQVERDKAIAELGQIRRVRDDIRAEAVELKSVLDRFSRQAIEASEMLGAAASGPLMSFDLPDFVNAEVALAGVVDDAVLMPERVNVAPVEPPAEDVGPVETDETTDSLDLDEFESTDDQAPPVVKAEPAVIDDDDDDWFATDLDDHDDHDGDDEGAGAEAEEHLADVIAIDAAAAEPPVFDPDRVIDVGEAGETEESNPDGSGAFLAEVRAAATDSVALPPESEGADGSDRFLSELRGVTESVPIEDVEIDDEAADRFFDSD